MKCSQCQYEKECNIKKQYLKITGCEGYSKERQKRDGEVKCKFCNEWVSEKEAFKHNTKNIYCCFKCY